MKRISTMYLKPAISCQLSVVSFRQRGFAIVSAIFLLVVLAALGAFMVTFSSSQHAATAIDIQSVRAYQAARAGVEWAMHQVLDLDPVNGNYPAADALPPCPAGAFPSAGFAGTVLAGFTTTVSCTRTTYTEGAKNIAMYAITATANSGAPGTPYYVERQVTVTATKCKDPDAPAPEYACS